MRKRVLLLAVMTLVAAAPARPDAPAAGDAPSVVREAILASWADRRTERDSLEIVYVPALAGRESGGVHVVWPDPPIPPGPRALTVERTEDGRVTARALANVVVHREIPVWVPVRTIARGDTARTRDFRRETRLWDRDPVRALTGDLPGRGFVVLRELTAGSWVRASDVRACPDVEAGDEILLVTRAPGAVVSIPAVVRRSGFTGEKILVLNPLTGAVVRARLLGEHRAELLTARGSAERRRT